MFPTYDISYDDFKGMIKSFSDELNYPFDKFSIERDEGKSKGVLFVYYKTEYYDANKNRLNLYVTIQKNQKNKVVVV